MYEVIHIRTASRYGIDNCKWYLGIGIGMVEVELEMIYCKWCVI